MGRKHLVEKQAQEIVSKYDACNLQAEKIQDTLTGPAGLQAQLLPVKILRVQERGHGTTGDVIAAKSEDIQENRKAENDGACAKPGRDGLAEANGMSKRRLTVRQTRTRV